MSYLPISEENKQAPQGQTTNQPGVGGPDTESPPTTGGSAGNAGGGGGGPAKGSATGSSTQFGSSASKLGDYLSANAPQVGQQAASIAGGLNTQYSNLNQGITNAANQFQQQVGQGYAAPNQAAVQQAVSDPTQFAMNPESVKAFQGQYNNAYTGPQSFTGSQGYGDIQGKVQAGQQQANLLGNQAGLQSYLQGQGGNPTRASSTLDALLLRGNPGAQQQINQAAGQFGGLTNQLAGAAQGADQSVLDAQKAAADSQAYARGEMDPYAQQFNTGLQNQVQQGEAGRTAYNTGLAANQAAAATGRAGLLSGQQTAMAPVEANFAHNQVAMPDYVRNAFNPNTAPYDQILSEQMNNNVATTANTATAPQYAQANALAQLLGQNYQSPLDQTQAGQAGTFQAGNLNPNTAANTNATGQTSYMNDLSSLYSNPNYGIPYYTDTSPQQTAQSVLDRYAHPAFGQAAGPNADQMAALQRLVGNQYAGR